MTQRGAGLTFGHGLSRNLDQRQHVFKTVCVQLIDKEKQLTTAELASECQT